MVQKVTLGTKYS